MLKLFSIGKAVEPTPIAPIHPLPQTAVVGVAGEVGGVGVACGFLVGAGHRSHSSLSMVLL